MFYVICLLRLFAIWNLSKYNIISIIKIGFCKMKSKKFHEDYILIQKLIELKTMKKIPSFQNKYITTWHSSNQSTWNILYWKRKKSAQRFNCIYIQNTPSPMLDCFSFSSRFLALSIWLHSYENITKLLQHSLIDPAHCFVNMVWCIRWLLTFLWAFT